MIKITINVTWRCNTEKCWDIYFIIIKALSTLRKLRCSLLFTIVIDRIVILELAQITVTALPPCETNFRKMETDATCTCVRDIAGGREGKRSFRNESYLRDSMEEGPRKGAVGGRPPAISTARPFRILKGKFPFIRAGFSPTELFEGARFADSSSDGK